MAVLALQISMACAAQHALRVGPAPGGARTGSDATRFCLQVNVMSAEPHRLLRQGCTFESQAMLQMLDMGVSNPQAVLSRGGHLQPSAGKLVGPVARSKRRRSVRDEGARLCSDSRSLLGVRVGARIGRPSPH